MSATPAASQTCMLARPVITPTVPDQPGQGPGSWLATIRIRCSPTNSIFYMAVCGSHRQRHLRLRDDPHRQKTHDIGRVGISKPGITQPDKNQTGLQVISAGTLAHPHRPHASDRRSSASRRQSKPAASAASSQATPKSPDRVHHPVVHTILHAPSFAVRSGRTGSQRQPPATDDPLQITVDIGEKLDLLHIVPGVFRPI